MDDFSYATPFCDASQPIAERDDRQSLLVIADWADTAALAPIAQAANLRLLGVTGLSEAAGRLDAQTQCDSLLLFCPTMTPMLERLLVQIETQAIQTGMAVVLVAGWETVELAFACLRSPHSQLLCDPDPVELAAALVAAGEAPLGVVYATDAKWIGKPCGCSSSATKLGGWPARSMR